MTAGDTGTWLYVPSSGYGYTVRVPVVIVRASGKRVRVKATRADGSTAEREVPRENLRLQCAFCHGRRAATVRDGLTGLKKGTIQCGRCDEYGEVPVRR